MANAKFWGSSPIKENTSSITSSSPAKSYSKKKVGIGSAGKGGVVFLGIVLAFIAFFYFTAVKPALALYSTARVLKSDISQISEALRSRDLILLNEELNKAEKDL